jgi:hypothetical protein
MMDDIAMAGKPYIVISANGDSPTNPMSLRVLGLRRSIHPPRIAGPLRR